MPTYGCSGATVLPVDLLRVKFGLPRVAPYPNLPTCFHMLLPMALSMGVRESWNAYSETLDFHDYPTVRTM